MVLKLRLVRMYLPVMQDSRREVWADWLLQLHGGVSAFVRPLPAGSHCFYVSPATTSNAKGSRYEVLCEDWM